MAFDELLADKVREALVNQENVSEKKMFQGLCFMVNEKMCICIREKELLCRIAPEKAETELEKGHSRQMMHNGKPMKGYIFVDETGYSGHKEFQYLVRLCLDFNKDAEASKRKK